MLAKARLTPQTLSPQERHAWLRLIRTENVGPITFYRLIERYGSASRAIEVLPGLSRRGGRASELKPPAVSDIDREFETMEKLGGRFVYAADSLYPLSLAAIEDAPPVLAVLGNPDLLNRAAIGIVGARNASLNGRRFAEKIAKELGQAGQVVASGLARGIDTSAHEGSLETGTIAVVAGGADVVYPQENTDLYRRIKDRGAIVSECPPGMEPQARHFPRRNRIISGLSAGVIVVEATLKSGSLITARMAGEQGRDVFAVPGHPMDPRAQGPNKLIQDGAVLVQSAMDVLQSLQTFSGRTKALHENMPPLPHGDPFQPPLSGDDQALEKAREMILENLSPVPVGVDELIRACQLTISMAQTVLLELELAGRLQRLPGNRVALV